MNPPVTIVELPGRRPCADCGGDVGTPCGTCGGCGSIGPDLKCVCGREVDRNGWHAWGSERLPLYFCGGGHQLAICFLPADEQKAA